MSERRLWSLPSTVVSSQLPKKEDKQIGKVQALINGQDAAMAYIKT
jgi:hypothetical protein